MRRNSVKLTAFAAVALVGGAVGLNCSKSSNPNGGDVKLAIVLPSGATISQVTYLIKNSSGGTIAGPTNFSVTDPNAKISLDIVVPVTPPGDAGDTITLTATEDGSGIPCTGTSPPFPVLAGTNPSVDLALTCGSSTQSTATGNIGITTHLVEGDQCPNITSGVVAPDETSVGGSVSVAATAFDADSGETLTYAWDPAANFANPALAATMYTCTAAGTQTFTLTVTDSHMPTPCKTTATFTIKCDNVATCGNGVVEPGEQCDPPDGVTCDSNCQKIAGTGGTTGAAGAPATGGTTGAAGAPATGGTSGAAGAPATGGTSGAAGAPATGGTSGAAGMSGAGGDPLACITCEQSGLPTGFCAQISPPGSGSTTSNTGCDGFTDATKKADCYALLNCLRGSACRAAIHGASADYGEADTYPQPFDDPHPCLCGNITLNACTALTSGWTGVCAQFYVQGAADDGLTVGNAFGNATSSVGVADNLSLCDIDQSCETPCMTTP